MMRVTVQINRDVVAQVDVVNDGTGTEHLGRYRCTLRDTDARFNGATFTVKGFRRSLGAVALSERVLREVRRLRIAILAVPGYRNRTTTPEPPDA